MKRKTGTIWIAAAVAACMILAPAWFSHTASGSEKRDCIHDGDVNHDGQITASDAQLAFFIVIGTWTPTYEEECAADCNGDGIVTASDAQAIFLAVLGYGECADPSPGPGGFVYIAPGTFTRGSPDTEPCRSSKEGPQHTVILTRGFTMMTTEVTRGMWADLKAMEPTLPDDPSDLYDSPTMQHPVQRVIWFEAVLFANLLSLQHGFPCCYYKDETFTIPVDAANYLSGPVFCNFNAAGYRLPTEAEWEYACRAGTTGPFWADEPDYGTANCSSCFPNPPLHVLNAIAWWCGNKNDGSASSGSTHPAGTKLANPWGLYDMHGNVWEWCWDWYEPYSSETVTDPAGPASGTQRVLRGGIWHYYASYCRSAVRESVTPGNYNSASGFRLLRNGS